MNFRSKTLSKYLKNSVALSTLTLASISCAVAGNYNIGAGIYDITGPAA